MTWEHGQLRTTKDEQKVRPFSREILSDIQYCKWNIDFDTGTQVAEGGDAAPIWWRGEAHYPAWLDYTLPLTLAEGELPNIPYYLLSCHASMPTRIDLETRHHASDTSGTTSALLYLNMSLRAGATEIMRFYAANNTALRWGSSSADTPPFYAPISGYAKYKSWNTSTTWVGKQGLVPDNIRFQVKVASWVNAYTDITFRMRCQEYLTLVLPEYRP